MVSVAPKATLSGALYQPLAFGCRDAVAVAAGAVASYLTPYEAELALPALSRQVPASVVAATVRP